jgi:hypothetical protein
VIDEKACEGGRTVEAWREMEQCLHCEMAVRHDLVNHPFWGFENACPLKQAIAKTRREQLKQVG